MKKIKLDARKLQLKKEKIASLTDDQMGNVMGGQPITTATLTTCCVLTPGPTNQLCLATNTCVPNTKQANCTFATTSVNGPTCYNVCLLTTPQTTCSPGGDS
jgi:hypothetical protein